MVDAAKAKVLLLQQDKETAAHIIGWLSPVATVQHIFEENQIINAVLAEPWDLVITDFSTETINDLEISKRIKSFDRRIPVIIITQHQKIDFILKALEERVDNLLFKPLDHAEFMQTAERLISRGRDNRSRVKNVILTISAHPDDAEIGCGGTLAQHQDKGDEIHMLTLSYGEIGGDPITRRLEAKRAANVFGANFYITRLKDTDIPDGAETIEIIEEIVSTINPTHVYTHTEHDTHKDHRSVHFATLSACRKVKNIYCYQSPSATTKFNPTLFIGLTEAFLEKKLQAISCFESQCGIRPYLEADMIRATARYWSRFNNYQLAEPMEIMRERLLQK